MNGTTGPRVFAVIPAAGQSARMGQPKQLLPFRGATLLQHVIETVRGAALDGLIVVTNARIDEALKLTADKRHLTAIARDPNAEMLDSIKLGIDRLSVRYLTKPGDAFLVCPGDVPAVTSALVSACAAEYRAHPGNIVVAACGGRPGHPLVAPFGLRGELDKLAGVGLKGLLATFAAQVRHVAAPSADALADVDTPAEYAALRDQRRAKSEE